MSARIFLAPFVVRRAGAAAAAVGGQFVSGAAAAVVEPGAVTFQGIDPTAFGFIVLFALEEHGTLAKISAERLGTISEICLLGFLGGREGSTDFRSPLL